VSAAARRAAAHRHTDAGPDQIVCLLCGRRFRAVTPHHLRRIHGFRGAHPIRDYKRRFRLRVAVSEETQRLVTRARRRQVRRHPTQRLWTKALLRAELRRRAQAGESLAPSRVPKALYATGRRLHGNWDGAMRAAGIDRDPHRIARQWSRESVLQAIRELAATGGPHSLAAIEYRDEGLCGAAKRRFGSWDKAVVAAGCQAQRRPASRRRWTWEAVRQWVLDRKRRGKPFTSKHVPLGLVSRVIEDTGEGWGAFIESLGVEYPSKVRHAKWSSAKVRRIILRRYRAGIATDADTVRREAPSLHAEAVRRFRSWKRAMAAACAGKASDLRRPAP